MKLAALTSSLRIPTLPASAEPSPGDEVRVQRIEALDSIAPDRKRSLLQEMAEIEPNAIGQFHGNDRILESARALAAELSALPGSLSRLVRLDQHVTFLTHIDDEV